LASGEINFNALREGHNDCLVEYREMHRRDVAARIFRNQGNRNALRGHATPDSAMICMT
jgi:hypothetical protein